MTGITKEKLCNKLLIQFSIVILSLTGVIAKLASGYKLLSLHLLYLYILEIVVFGIYALIWQQVIKKSEISVAYANKGTMIIWTFLWARFFFNETITLANIVGSLIIITGIVVLFKDE
jgi:multidrug transporter EmrE-like cation transporter